MGSVNLDNTGSGADVTLSSDGTSLLLDGTAIGGGGGADLYAAETTGSTNPTASGTLSLAIGSAASSTGLRSLAIGRAATAAAQDSVAIGTDANAGSATGSVAIKGNISGSSSAASVSILGATTAVGTVQIGSNGYVQAAGAVAIGYNADVESSGSGGVSIGENAHVNGANAVALGNSRANGASSFAAVITNNTTSYGATGANSIAMVKQAKATGSTAIALGWLSQSTAAGSVVIGSGAGQATATGAVSIGGYIQAGAKATGVESMALGNSAVAAEQGKLARSCGHFGAAGDAQGGQFILRADTTDATATVLTTNNSTAGSTNQIVAASDTCITFDGTITAMQNGAQAYASWKIEGLLVNDGGTTTLANSATTVIQNLSSWGMALSADNTNNALAITVTGEAAHNIRWVANIRTTEVTYA